MVIGTRTRSIRIEEHTNIFYTHALSTNAYPPITTTPHHLAAHTQKMQDARFSLIPYQVSGGRPQGDLRRENPYTPCTKPCRTAA